jgi:hypothetical protein
MNYKGTTGAQGDAGTAPGSSGVPSSPPAGQ